jgi:hypothetical protein
MPRMQVWLIAVQSLHCPPPMPHAALVVCMTHVPDWQQPMKQLRRLHRPPPPELLPLPDMLPLELDPEDATEEQDPLWQVRLPVVQSWHAPAFRPHAELSVPGMQPRLGSQQPLHDGPQLEASLPGLASSLEVPASSAALPLVPPPLPEALPLAGGAPLLGAPLPLDVPSPEDDPDDVLASP